MLSIINNGVNLNITQQWVREVSIHSSIRKHTLHNSKFNTRSGEKYLELIETMLPRVHAFVDFMCKHLLFIILRLLTKLKKEEKSTFYLH